MDLARLGEDYVVFFMGRINMYGNMMRCASKVIYRGKILKDRDGNNVGKSYEPSNKSDEYDNCVVFDMKDRRFISEEEYHKIIKLYDDIVGVVATPKADRIAILEKENKTLRAKLAYAEELIIKIKKG